MNRYAIHHVVDTPYAYAKDINTLRVRIRTAKADIKTCKIHYKDRYDWQGSFKVKEMKVELSTDLFDFFDVDIHVDRNRYRYFFELIDVNGDKIFFDEIGFREDDLECNEMSAFQFAYIGKADVYREEKWLQEAVVYQIFPDRFWNGDKSNDPENTREWGGSVDQKSMFGGDLQGIIDKIDYIKDLGVDLIYLTPIFKSKSNHKYNTTDYFEIDSQFGTLDKAKELVDKCHEKGMKIIFDAVFNHSGSDFFAFKDLIEKQEKSKYKDWYFADEFPVDTNKTNYYTFANDVSNMPKLDTSNEEVKEYLLKVAEYWIKEIGIDGWRLDVCDEVDHEFWRAFRKTVKKANKDAVVIGEIMHEASSFLKGDQLDSIMNYPFKNALTSFFAYRNIGVEKFDNILAFNRGIYTDSIVKQMWNLFGSHDTKRFLTECDNHLERMIIAIAFQFTYIGVPYIYYGDEIGLDGGEEPQSRKCMIWNEEKQNKELLTLYKKLIKIRKNNICLVHGDYKVLTCEDNILVFERNYKDEKIIVVINNNYEEKEIKLPMNGRAKELVSEDSIYIDGKLSIKEMGFNILKINE